MWSKRASLEWFGSAEPFTSKRSSQSQNCENVCVCVCTPVLALCSSSRYWAECVSSISSICSTFFLPRAARILDAFFRRNVFRFSSQKKTLAFVRTNVPFCVASAAAGRGTSWTLWRASGGLGNAAAPPSAA